LQTLPHFGDIGGENVKRLIQNLVRNVLTALGFWKITIANSAKKAIELIKAQDFDIIITDWRMKDGDGIDLIRYVRLDPESRNIRIPIILLTGNTQEKYITTARDAGVNEYMIKPFSAEQIAQRIRSIFEHPKRFIKCATYCGPDRRFHNKPPGTYVEKRKEDFEKRKSAATTSG